MLKYILYIIDIYVYAIVYISLVYYILVLYTASSSHSFLIRLCTLLASHDYDLAACRIYLR